MIRCTRIEHEENGTLRGFVDLELTKVGLIIRDCRWHKKGNREWVEFPAVMVRDRYEAHDGKRNLKSLLEITNPYFKDQFRAAAVAAIHEFLPKKGRRDYGKEVSDERTRAGDDPALLPGKASQDR
jgi:hypothetical protein